MSQKHTPIPLVETPQEDQYTQSEHPCRGPRSDPYRLHDFQFSVCEPCLVDSVGHVPVVSLKTQTTKQNTKDQTIHIWHIAVIFLEKDVPFSLERILMVQVLCDAHVQALRLI